MRARAKIGRGAELAERILAAADEIEAEPGCDLYLVGRQADAPDVVWVTEIWRSREDLEAVRSRVRDSKESRRALALVDDWETIELDLVGGKLPARSPVSR